MNSFYSTVPFGSMLWYRCGVNFGTVVTSPCLGSRRQRGKEGSIGRLSEVGKRWGRKIEKEEVVRYQLTEIV